MMKTLVIVPTYNEAENLPRLVQAVLAVDQAISILVVDDNSPDGTGQIADVLSRETGRVEVVHRSGKLGLGSAYITGFKYALARDYEAIVEMDADFSHRPEDLPLLLAAARTADVVIGSRSVPGGRTENWSLVRQAVSKGGSLYVRLALGLKIKDCTAGFKCFRRRALAALDLDKVRSSGFGFQVEMNYLCHTAGMRMVEVPIVFPDRMAGQSKMSGNIFMEALTLVWQLRLQPAATLPIYTALTPPVYTAVTPISTAHAQAFTGQLGLKETSTKGGFNPELFDKNGDEPRNSSIFGVSNGSAK